MIDWKKVTTTMMILANGIVKRAERLAKDAGVDVDRISMQMDLLAAAVVEKINLEKLSGFDDTNLGHDVFGISRHLDRETGKIGGGFWPRCGSVKS